MVKKKDNTNRVCVDYWKLNKLTEFDPEPMPAAEHLFQKLSGNKKKISPKGYWQIIVPEENIPETAFVTPDGSYEFLKMPFGMINSAATLKRAMKKLIEDLDDVDFYSMIYWFTPARGRNILEPSESCFRALYKLGCLSTINKKL